MSRAALDSSVPLALHPIRLPNSKRLPIPSSPPCSSVSPDHEPPSSKPVANIQFFHLPPCGLGKRPFLHSYQAFYPLRTSTGRRHLLRIQPPNGGGQDSDPILTHVVVVVVVSPRPSRTSNPQLSHSHSLLSSGPDLTALHPGGMLRWHQGGSREITTAA